MHHINSDLPHAGLMRRLAAMFYDSLLVLALLFLATALVLPVTGGEAVDAGSPLFTAYLCIVIFGFFGGFWVHGGQTLGMRTWRLRVQTRNGDPIGWGHAVLRYVGAWVSALTLGLGYLWVLVDRERLTWHDRFSGTVIVVLPKGRWS